ncbi:YdcF family protein [Streptosporangium sp. NBC_01755]|uniref:YdcF family protein n=1 Tax=unclassified Streptosporangium TaxID=2632669 RepID=UPI002DDA80FD|nr:MULTISPECIES: YdcF family protein [unclassified Streptosporangium]WSA26676.1 YdcF family protein [Streptosporangium sp. NBC_01810]WSD01900.1 YdcF family protein [Streptosporangium sp. NBC_01755]
MTATVTAAPPESETETAARFPRGEAVHYREHAIELGVPAEAIIVEPRARNTGDNITLSRRLLEPLGVDSVLLVSKPYAERRAFATCRRLWPEVDVVCASDPLPLPDYVTTIGDEHLVIAMIVGSG